MPRRAVRWRPNLESPQARYHLTYFRFGPGAHPAFFSEEASRHEIWTSIRHPSPLLSTPPPPPPLRPPSQDRRPFSPEAYDLKAPQTIMGPLPPPQDRFPSHSSDSTPLTPEAVEVGDLLRNLKVEPQSDFPEVSQSQDGNISDSSGDASASSDYTNNNSNTIALGNGHEVNPESGIFYSTNGYTTHAAYAYEYTQGADYEDFPRYVGLNGLDPSMYPETGAVVYQTGYGYAAAQQPYGGAYAPGPFPVYAAADGQLYPYHAPVYHQGHYSVVDAADAPKADGDKSVPRPGYPVTYMAAPYGYYPVTMQQQQPAATQQNARNGRVFEGLRATAPAWVDTRSSENRSDQSPKPQVLDPVTGPSSEPLEQAQQLQQPESATAPGALGTAFPPLTRAAAGGASGNKAAGGRVQSGGRVEDGGGGGGGGGDPQAELNRGPRTASKARFQRVFPVFKQKGYEFSPELVVGRGEYNKPDFSTSYKDAKFYIIKSYSEDDVHKSIKYGVWASTPTGNKRLDVAYQEAEDRKCPLFLFFSVNGSGQFCGVAEMTGPVDFIKSMDFWQQDKWSGRFSVKWHLIKDIPNSHFRHIILENNENKPVTNSRDTQEVQFDQGSEMLRIFKNFPCNTSLLDDFQYYDTRQKAMQEKRSRQSQEQLQLQQDLKRGSKINESGAEKPTGDGTGTTNGRGGDASVPKKSYLRSLAGEKDVASNNIIDVQAAA